MLTCGRNSLHERVAIVGNKEQAVAFTLSAKSTVLAHAAPLRQEARREQLRARKLDDHWKLDVVDLGAAPGGWRRT